MKLLTILYKLMEERELVKGIKDLNEENILNIIKMKIR